MKARRILMLLIFGISVTGQGGSAQTSPNLPSERETGVSSYSESFPEQLSALEQRHKQTMEAGNLLEANKIKAEMDKLMPDRSKSVTMPEGTDFVPSNRGEMETESDWAKVNSIVHQGNLKSHEGYYKNIDMKIGEDGNLYLAAIRQQSGFTSGIVTYKSTNRGLSWSYVYGINYLSSYIGNISLLVESRNNSYRDSTRLVVFYNLSSSQFMDNASIHYFSCRANGSAQYSGILAYPSAGNEFSNLCAVSDGAFYQNATYFGVVFMESTNNLQSKVSMRYFRTNDWGSTWTNAAIQTNYNDFCPSIDFKEGPTDSIYIAVERRFDTTNSLVRVISIPFLPSSSFFTYFPTSGGTNNYRNPCITIKQNTPVDSMMMTFTKNGKAFLMYSANAGANWNGEYEHGSYSGNNTSFVYCSSSPSGSEPFTTIWLTSDGDSLNISRGRLGLVEIVSKKKINSTGCFSKTTPVCATITELSGNFAAAAYAGALSETTPSNVYCNQEGIKLFQSKLVLEGFYDPNTDQMRREDTLTAILHSPAAPYTAYDTAKGVLNPTDFNCSFNFTRVKPGSCYIDIRHRNSVQTWTNSDPFVTFNNYDSVFFNFTLSPSSAWGYNQVKVDNSPNRYGFFSGDVNQDGTVDASDLSAIDNDANYFASGYVNTDLTGDDFVDATDYAVADNNATKFVSTVHP